MTKEEFEDVVEVTIYYLVDPVTDEIRYVGRTKNSLKARLNGHLSKTRKGEVSHKNSWIRKLLSQELKPRIVEVKKVTGWHESYLEEIRIIGKLLKNGFNLTNCYDRGEGHLRNEMSEESKKHLSAKIRQLHKDGKLHSKRRKVLMFDLDGNFIQEFISLRDCAKWLKIKPKHLDSYFSRGDKTLKGWQIIREGETAPTKYIKPIRKGKGVKKIYLLNISSGSYISFNSRKDCLEFLGKTSNSYIHTYLDKDKICQNKYKIKSTNE